MSEDAHLPLRSCPKLFANEIPEAWDLSNLESNYRWRISDNFSLQDGGAYTAGMSVFKRRLYGSLNVNLDFKY